MKCRPDGTLLQVQGKTREVSVALLYLVKRALQQVLLTLAFFRTKGFFFTPRCLKHTWGFLSFRLSVGFIPLAWSYLHSDKTICLSLK